MPSVNPQPTAQPTAQPTSQPTEKPNSENGDSNNNKNFIFDLSKFFPFCIPFDLIHLFQVLEAEPEAPHFEIPIEFKPLNYTHIFIIDFSMFESVAKIVRLGQIITFCLGLILITRNIIKG